MQPEVFALSHLCIMAAIYLWHQNKDENSTAGLAIKTSLLIGVSIAQHPITVVALPFWLGLMQRHLRTQPQKLRAFTSFIFPGAALAFFAYGMMLWQQQTTWPTWGGIDTLQDAFAHFLRLEYGSLDLQGDQAGDASNALFISLTHNAMWGTGLYIVCTIGFIFSTLKRGVTATHFPVLAFVLTTVLFCGMATSYGDPETSFCIAYRFTALSWMMLLLCASIFLSQSSHKLRRHKLVALLAAFQLGSLLAHEIPNILAMRDQTFAVFQRTIKNDIGDNDLYVSASDVEDYLSSIEPNMASRAPLDISFYGKEWYRKQLQKRLPRHFANQQKWPQQAGELLYEKWKNGTTLKSSLAHLLAIPDTSPKLEGLLFINSAENTAPPAPMQRLQKHIALCSDLIELSDLPGSPFVEDVNDLRRTRRFAFLHAFRFFYLRSFADAYEIAQAEKLPAELTKQIGAIIESFQTGINAEIWKDQCRQLQETMMF